MQVASTFRRLQAAAITNPEDAAAVAAANREPASLIDVPQAAFPLFMTTRDWLKALDASCAESFFARTADGHLVGREIDDWDGIGLEVDLGQDDWMDEEGDEYEDDVSDYSSSSADDDDAQPDEVPNWQEGWDQPGAAAAAADAVGRRQRRRAKAAGQAEEAAVHGNGHAAVQHLLAHEITYVSAAGFLCRETRPRMCLVLKLGSKGEAHVADMDAIASQLSSCSMLEGLVSYAVLSIDPWQQL